MTILRKISIEEEVDLIGITLLSVDEAENIRCGERACGLRWWLRSPKGCFRVAYVRGDGTVGLDGDAIDFKWNAVRPALIYKSEKLHAGDEIIFNDYKFRVIDEKYALCTTYIRLNRFDFESNDYEKSEIKNLLQEWFNAGINK